MTDALGSCHVANENGLLGTDNRDSDNELVLEVADEQMQPGESYEVIFHARDFKNISAYQFSLDFDADQLSFSGLTLGELPNSSKSNFGLSNVQEGFITTSWHNVSAVNANPDTEHFEVITRKR